MEARHYTVRGRVIDRETRRGVSGLKTEAWDKDTKFHDLLGCAMSDARGGFRIEFNELMFGDYGGDELPDLFFRVYRGRRLLASTEDSVLQNVRDAETEVTIEVDLPRKPPEGRDLVSAGQVMKGVDWLRRSDLRGVRKEAVDRVSIVQSVVGDAVKGRVGTLNAMSALLGPVQSPDVGANEIVGHDVETARRRLEQRQVNVSAVKTYQPTVDRSGLQLLTRMPVNLKQGDQVELYQENGRVRYYAVPRKQREAGAAPDTGGRARADDTRSRADVDRVERELRQKGEELEQVKAELAQLKRDVAAMRGGGGSG